MRNIHSRRNRFRSNTRRYRRNGSNGHSNPVQSFGISSPSSKNNYFNRNNQNASKLLEKYTDLAREALSSGDKILSENYFQHADHFSRVVSNKNAMQDNNNLSKSKEETNTSKEETNTSKEETNTSKEETNTSAEEKKDIET